MKTAIVTDSNSGIFRSDAEQLGVYVIPMPIVIDGTIRFENEDITPREFYQAMENDREISTSQPAPGSITAVWNQVLSSADELVYIPMSSGLSGSYEAALYLADGYDGKVKVADNHRISVTQYQSVLRAAHLAEEGRGAEEICAILEHEARESSVYLTVDTLKYFRRSGRVTPAAAALGDFLNIKPVLFTRGDTFDVVGNFHGHLKAETCLIDSIRRDRNTLFPGVPNEELYIAAADSFSQENDSLRWRKKMADAFPEYDLFWAPLSLNITCHTGPNAFGSGVFRKP
ncbi:MAG: DegV family protein [Solobacterium sp.]|nr:DegV family protein [Solobacterium sp.]